MELQFQKTTCPCLGRAVREVKNAELTQEVRLSDGMPDIGRVVASWGQVILRSKEWRGDQASVSGGVMAWILYAPEDGGEARSVDTWIPFQMKWDLPGIDRDGPVRICPLLRFVDSRTVSARKIMVRLGVAAMAEALYPMEAEIFSQQEAPGDIEFLRKKYPLQLPREAGEKTFLLDEELTLPGSMPPVEKIIRYGMQPELTDQKVLANKVVFRGTGNLHLLYRCAEGNLHSWDFELAFSQFADLEGTYSADAQGDHQLAVTSLEVERNEAGQLRVKCALVSQYLVSDRTVVEVVEDAYSPFRAVSPEMGQLTLPAMLETRRETVSAEQTLHGQSGEILDVCFLPDFPRQRTGEDRVTLEVSGLFQVLCRGENSGIQAGTSRWEDSVEIPGGEACRLDTTALCVGRPQAAAGTEGIVLTGKVLLTTDATAQQGLPMVTGLEVGEVQEPDPARPSLILCRSRGEELWQIAKRCGSTVAAIRRANGLKEEPDGDGFLLIPVS